MWLNLLVCLSVCTVSVHTLFDTSEDSTVNPQQTKNVLATRPNGRLRIQVKVGLIVSRKEGS
jgi:hypothetical protein